MIFNRTDHEKRSQKQGKKKKKRAPPVRLLGLTEAVALVLDRAVDSIAIARFMAADRTANRTSIQISDSIFHELSSTRGIGAPVDCPL